MRWTWHIFSIRVLNTSFHSDIIWWGYGRKCTKIKRPGRNPKVESRQFLALFFMLPNEFVSFVLARRLGNWDDALDIVVANSRSVIEQGFSPEIIPKRDELPAWTEGQWATVLERLTTTPDHAVLRKELEKEVAKGDGKTGQQIILSMVKYNLLALRPYSTMARDLPREVYGVGQKEVVTLPSPGHVWTAKRELLERKSDAYKSAAELAEKAKSKPKKYFGVF